MTIANSNVIAKIAAVVAGFGLVAMSFAPVAKADTTTDVNAQIQALLSQIASLQAQLGGSQSAAVVFNTDLTIGSTGTSVTALQTWLIGKGYSIPAGATGYFGAQTKAAVAAWQAASGITPAVGYFGPVSRAKANASGGTTTGGTTTGGTTTGSTSGLSGGEATLSSFDLVAESGDLRENTTGAQIVSAKFDVKSGDVRVERADLEFQGTNNTDDVKPWKYIKSISAWNGSTKLATMDVSNQDAWDDNDADSNHNLSSGIKYYKVSFTGLNYVVREGDSARLTFTVDTVSSIDTANESQIFKVDVPTQGIRAIDSVGINQYAGSDTDKVSVSVTSAQNGKLTVSEASSNPLAAVIVADTTDTSSDFNVLAFTIKNTQSTNSKVTDLTFDVATTTASGSSAVDITSIIRKATLTIGGQSYDGDINANKTVVFNDVDTTISGNSNVTGTVKVQLYGATSHFATTGESLTFSLAHGKVVAENASSGDTTDPNDITGTAQGKTQTIAITAGVNVVGGSSTTNLTYNNTTPSSSYGSYTLSFSVTAVGDDIYVPATIGTSTGSTTWAGVLINPALQASTVGTTSTAISSTAQTSGSYGMYKVSAGSTETFTASVTIDPSASGFYQIGLDSVKFSRTNDLAGLQTLNIDETQTQFKSNSLNIPNS